MSNQPVACPIQSYTDGVLRQCWLLYGHAGPCLFERENGSTFESYGAIAAKPKPDEVNHPAHYNQGGVECIDAIAAALGPEAFAGFLRGNAIKYLWRCQHKGSQKQDLEKARWYLDKLLDEMVRAS